MWIVEAAKIGPPYRFDGKSGWEEAVFDRLDTLARL
jgi:hypothetical protein